MPKGISIDRKKRLREEPRTGHNRWHPDIAPVIEVEPGEEVTLETRDAADLQIGPRTTVAELAKMERTAAHPLTGPVYVKGARPGDLLEIEYLDIVPERYGWTRFSPGFGFLPDLFDYFFVVHWDITPEYATSPQLPRVRIPNGSFMGTAGVAPSREQLKAWSVREKELADRGGRVLLPTAAAAVPAQGPIAEEGLHLRLFGLGRVEVETARARASIDHRCRQQRAGPFGCEPPTARADFQRQAAGLRANSCPASRWRR